MKPLSKEQLFGILQTEENRRSQVQTHDQLRASVLSLNYCPNCGSKDLERLSGWFKEFITGKRLWRCAVCKSEHRSQVYSDTPVTSSFAF